MRARAYFAAGLVGLALLSMLALASGIHGEGETDCPTVEGDHPGEPTYDDHESDMGADDDEAFADCPVDDGTGMGAPSD